MKEHGGEVACSLRPSHRCECVDHKRLDDDDQADHAALGRHRDAQRTQVVSRSSVARSDTMLTLTWHNTNPVGSPSAVSPSTKSRSRSSASC